MLKGKGPAMTQDATGHDHQSFYKAIVLARKGGPEDLLLKSFPVEEPGPLQLRIRVCAVGVGATDLSMLKGTYIYAPKMPFVPGYEVAGSVEAVGSEVKGFSVGQRVAALTVHGGFGELLVREARDFVSIPDGVSDVAAAAAILNYVTAWQMIHRVANVQSGQTVLVTGAAGGVGTALLQLLALAGAKTYGAASIAKHPQVSALGATPIDYRTKPIDHLIREVEPAGVDYVFDAIGGANIGLCIGAARRGGLVVGYGFMGVGGFLATLKMFANLFVGTRLLRRRGAFYGITKLYRKKPELLHEDLLEIFSLIAQKKITPLIANLFPLLEAPKALRLLATGTVQGKIVLTNSR
jgi:NADPH2:quinone reductase